MLLTNSISLRVSDLLLVAARGRWLEVIGAAVAIPREQTEFGMGREDVLKERKSTINRSGNRLYAVAHSAIGRICIKE